MEGLGLGKDLGWDDIVIFGSTEFEVLVGHPCGPEDHLEKIGKIRRERGRMEPLRDTNVE